MHPFDALRQRFVVRCAADLEAVRSLRQSWCGPDGAAFLPETLAKVDSIAGAAGTFGFPQLSAIAADAEDTLIGDDVRAPAVVAHLDALIACLAGIVDPS